MKKSRNRERFLTQEEEGRLLEALPAKHHDVIVFLLDTGLRVREALKLEWTATQHHPDFAAITLRSSKSGRMRTVPLTARAKACLVRAKAAGQWRPFVQTYAALHKAFNIARHRAGLDVGEEPIVIHSLRHSCASRLVQKGANLYLVQNWLGHSSPATTARYAHLSPDALFPLVGLLERTG
jgi:integrase